MKKRLKRNETKEVKLRSGALKKRNKMDESLAWLTKKKRTQISIIRNEKDVTIDTTEIQNHIKDYYEQLSINKLDNLKWINS